MNTPNLAMGLMLISALSSVDLAQERHPEISGRKGDPVRDVDVSLGKKPKPIIDRPIKDVVVEMGGEANSSIKESGISLNDLMGARVETEMVWRVVLTTSQSTLAYRGGGWTPLPPPRGAGRTAYWHVGFDKAGTAVASMVWLGKSLQASTSRTGATLRDPDGPAYWGIENGAIVSALGTPSSFEYYPEPAAKGVLTDPHKCSSRCPIHTKGGITPPKDADSLIGILLPQRNADGSYGQRGWTMARGMSEGVNWVMVGRAWPVLTTYPVGGNDPAGFLFLMTPRNGLLISDACLILQTRGEPQYGKIVPQANDAAVKQNGAK